MFARIIALIVASNLHRSPLAGVDAFSSLVTGGGKAQQAGQLL